MLRNDIVYPWWWNIRENYSLYIQRGCQHEFPITISWDSCRFKSRLEDDVWVREFRGDGREWGSERRDTVEALDIQTVHARIVGVGNPEAEVAIRGGRRKESKTEGNGGELHCECDGLLMWWVVNVMGCECDGL